MFDSPDPPQILRVKWIKSRDSAVHRGQLSDPYARCSGCGVTPGMGDVAGRIRKATLQPWQAQLGRCASRQRGIASSGKLLVARRPFLHVTGSQGGCKGSCKVYYHSYI